MYNQNQLDTLISSAIFDVSKHFDKYFAPGVDETFLQKMHDCMYDELQRLQTQAWEDYTTTPIPLV